MMNLADPELELIDPTPNIYSMFLQFDRTFFWSRLSSRCVVRWSKRMYSCAGICSCEGKRRGGLCSIALSEPLLKLRPRKDLMETLLHEMIHAFLFITNQDRDRDGHGPNFKEHMHRINRITGLNISIYHDFHDEVMLYQTHWWQCNGPCKFRTPYYGIVRRTNNRAPGPSDCWWSSHQRNCGGKFIKIKEPDKAEKKGKKTNKDETNQNTDIRKYINTNNNNKETSNKNKVPAPTVSINTDSTSNLVVTKENVVFNPQEPKSKPVVTNGTGQTILTKQPSNGERKKTSSTDVLETVRAVWSDKQIGTNNIMQGSKDNNSSTASTQNKQKSGDQSDSPPSKMKKIDDYFKTTATTMLKDLYGQDFNITQPKGDKKLKAIPTKSNLVDCPLCSSKIDSDEINSHLDECLNKDVIKKLSKESVPLVTSESSVTIQNVDKSDDNRSPNIVKPGVVVPEIDNKNTDILKNNKSSNNKRAANSDIIDLTDLEFTTAINSKRSRYSFDQADLRVNEQTKSLADNNNNNQRKSDSFKGPSANIVQTTPILTPTINIQNVHNSDDNRSHNIVKPGVVVPERDNKNTDIPKDNKSSNNKGVANSDIINLTDIELATGVTGKTSRSSLDCPVHLTITQPISDKKLKATPTKSNLVDCPLCSSKIDSDEINSHLNECLNKDVTKKLSKESVPLVTNESSVNNKNVDKSHDGRSPNVVTPGVVGPETDNKSTDILKYNKSSNNKEVANSDIIDLTDIDSDSFQGPSANIVQTAPTLTSTIILEPSRFLKNAVRKCKCCGNKVSDPDEHLSECLDFCEKKPPKPRASTSYETIVIKDDGTTEERELLNPPGTKLTCPRCFKMFEVIDFYSHMDECLK